MKIKDILSTHRNDFTAIMECEHCSSTQRLGSGYNDGFYHERVIPAMTCNSCGRNRAGEVPQAKNDNGVMHVPA